MCPSWRRARTVTARQVWRRGRPAMKSLKSLRPTAPAPTAPMTTVKIYKIAAQEAIALYKAGVKAAETAEKDMHTASAGSEGKEK